jgi:hypothetical protein
MAAMSVPEPARKLNASTCGSRVNSTSGESGSAAVGPSGQSGAPHQRSGGRGHADEIQHQVIDLELEDAVRDPRADPAGPDADGELQRAAGAGFGPASCGGQALRAWDNA